MTECEESVVEPLRDQSRILRMCACAYAMSWTLGTTRWRGPRRAGHSPVLNFAHGTARAVAAAGHRVWDGFSMVGGARWREAGGVKTEEEKTENPVSCGARVVARKNWQGMQDSELAPQKQTSSKDGFRMD